MMENWFVFLNVGFTSLDPIVNHPHNLAERVVWTIPNLQQWIQERGRGLTHVVPMEGMNAAFLSGTHAATVLKAVDVICWHAIKMKQFQAFWVPVRCVDFQLLGSVVVQASTISEANQPGRSDMFHLRHSEGGLFKFRHHGWLATIPHLLVCSVLDAGRPV